ncbi:hypothetical protein CerSpe_147920 [Prunus speciosa]
MDNLILRFSSGSPRFQVCKDHISFTNQCCILGPRYLEKKAGQLIRDELHDARAPLPHLNPGGVSWANWVKYLPRFYPKVGIKGCEMSWATWVKRMEPKFRDSWISNGTYHAIMCSAIQLQPDEALLSSALMFWNSASNTFDFGVGPMSISILDLAVVFGFRPHGRSADCLADFERTPEENGQMGLRIDDMTCQINVNRAFGLFMKNFQGVESADPQVEHMMFLLYWLNRFIFPNASGNITMEWIHLAEALAYHSDVAIGPLLLASIYRCLRDITVVPFNMNVNGPLWMVQVWLQWQFPELRASQLEFAEDKAPMEQLLSSPISGKTTEECFTFFQSKRARSPDQWKMSMRRKYPWFMGTSFHLGPKDASKPLASENMEIFSCLKGRDLLLGGRQDLRHYTYGVEAYCPQFFSRQFGCPQVIPEIDYSLLNRGSSFRTSDFSRDDLLRVRNKYKTAAQSQELKPYQPDFNCTDAFQKWWAEHSRRLSTSCTELTYDKGFILCPFEKKLSHEARLSLNDRLEEENRHLMTLAADCWVFPPASSSTENAQQGEAVPAAPARAPIFFQRKHKMGKTAPAASPILKSSYHSKAAETEFSSPPPTVSKRTKQFAKRVRSPQTKTASTETANTEGLGEPNSDGDGRSGKKARTSTEEPDEPSTVPGVFTSSVGHMVAAFHTIVVQLDLARGGSILNTLPVSQVKEVPSGPVVVPFPGASKAPSSSTALTTNPTKISDGEQPSNSPIGEGQDGETGAEPSSPILATSAEAFNADPFSEEGNDAPNPVVGNAEPDLDQLLEIITEQNFEQSTPQLLLCSEPAFPDVKANTASTETANTEGLGEPNSDGDGRSGKKARTSTEEPDEPSTVPGVFTSSVGHMVAAFHTIVVQLDLARGGSILNTLPVSQVKEGPSGPVVVPFPGASKDPSSSIALTTNPTEISDGEQPSNSPIEEGQDGETGAEPSLPILAISAEAFNADPFSEEGNDAPSPVAGNAGPDLDQLFEIIMEQNFEQSAPQLLLCSELAFPDVSITFGLPRSLYPTIDLWRIDRALVTGPSGSTTEEGRAEDILVLAPKVPEAVVNLDALQVQNSENLVQDSPLSALTPASSCPIVVEKDSVLEVFQEKPQMEDVSKEEARSIVDNWMLDPLNMRTSEDALRNVSQALQVLGQFYPRLRTTLEKAVASLDSLPGRLGEFNYLLSTFASLWKIQLQLDQEEKTQEQRLLRAKEVKEDLARMDSRLSNSEARFCQLINSNEAAIEKAKGTLRALECYKKESKIIDADIYKLLKRLKGKDVKLREILLDLGHFSSLLRDFLLTVERPFYLE